MSTEDRLTDLELRFMTQENLLQELDNQVREANEMIALLQRRCVRLEAQIDQMLDGVDRPANERPPHY